MWPRFRRARAPVCSRSSSETTASFIREQSETSRRRTPQSRLRIGPAFSSSHERKFQSSPAPYFTASARPCRKSSSFWERRHSTSERTHSAGWKAPTRFFPSGRFAPVFPPMALSAWARRVVGHWMSRMPRIQVAAAKPAASPVTPPPRARIVSVRSIPHPARDV
ncbi:hypothetical protein SDC9_163223 [bioreactor metagenome]|uniref:Uncharacterized protein n=1 Tax=bioreactor metagenome TaxID=1076179 RepID=A0A645FN83_9ZZZZ